MTETDLTLGWLDEVNERAKQGTATLLKQADEIAEATEEPDEEPDAADQWVRDLAAQLHGNRDDSRDLLLKAGYSATEADDLLDASGDAPSAETLMQKARSMSAPATVYRRIGQDRNGRTPE